MMRRALVFLAAVCACSAPPSFVVVSREITLRGDGLTVAPVRASDRAGRVVPLSRLHWESRDPQIAEVSSGLLKCRHEGVTKVRVSLRAAADSFQVRCDAVQLLRLDMSIALALGGPARALYVAAVRDGGREEAIADAHWSVEDSSVARVRGDSLVAVSVGTTKVRVDLGGRMVTEHVTVAAPLRTDTVALDPGRFRNWDLGPGRYVLTVQALSGDTHAVAFEGRGVRCVADVRVEERVHCVVRDAGALSMRNVATTGAPVRALVHIAQVP